MLGTRSRRGDNKTYEPKAWVYADSDDLLKPDLPKEIIERFKWNLEVDVLQEHACIPALPWIKVLAPAARGTRVTWTSEDERDLGDIIGHLASQVCHDSAKV